MDSVDPRDDHPLRQTAFKGDTSDAQFIALLIVANQYGLNPWTKEIYAFLISRTALFRWWALMAGPASSSQKTSSLMAWTEQDNESCTCGYRKDRNHPFVTEWMDECRREPFKTRERQREITGAVAVRIPKRMLRQSHDSVCAVWPSDLLVSMTRMKPGALSKILHIHCRTSAGTRHHSVNDETMQEIDTLPQIILDKTWDDAAALFPDISPRHSRIVRTDTGRSSESS